MLISEAFNDMVGDDPTGFNFVTHISVETKTDAYRTLSDGWSLTQYISQYGDVEVEYDEKFKVYRVPAFAKEIASFKTLKAAHCARWGCE